MDLQEIKELSDAYNTLNEEYNKNCVTVSNDGAVYTQSVFCTNLNQQVKEAYAAYRNAINSYEPENPSVEPTPELDENGNPIGGETEEGGSGKPISVEPVCGVIRDQVIAYIEYYADKFPQTMIAPAVQGPDGSNAVVIGRPSTYNQTVYDLNKIGNKIIRIIGGSLLPESFEQEYPIKEDGENTGMVDENSGSGD